MKSKNKLIRIMFMISVICIILMSTSLVLAKEYSDLKSSHWAYGPINTMSEKGILSGYPDGSFGPDKSITRAEFAKIIVLTLQLNEKSNMSFDDLPENHWANEYVNIASNYLSAYRNGEKYLYMPDTYAVREDIAVAIVNAAGLNNAEYSLSTLDKFSDKDLISENIKKYIAIAVENGLMKGNANGTFNPQGKLTRAEVSQLMINSLDVLEKIAIADLKEVKFVYDEATGTIDLGSGWANYKYTYSNTNKKSGTIYTPSQRVLSYNQYRTADGNQDGSRFCGKYVFIMDKNDTDNYISIKVSNPFKNIKYDKEEGTINLGSDWKDFKYSYTSEDSESKGKIYIPSQRKLIYSNESMPAGEIQKIFREDVVYIYLKDNLNSFMKIRVYEPEVKEEVEEETEEENELPSFKYNKENGTIDLGSNWENYKYTYSNTNKKGGTIYTPSQRILSYNQYRAADGNQDGSRFCGKYVFIMDKNDTNNYVQVKVSNPFDDIEYNQEIGTIDLGSDWKNYKYSYTIKESDSKGKIYTPSQRTLTYSHYSIPNSEEQEIFNSDYVYVYLKNNTNSYRRIDVYKPTKLPEFKYDKVSGTIDLGANWQGYKYSYTTGNGNKIDGAIYVPSQRVLSFNDYNYCYNYDTFTGKYVFIIDKTDPSNYVAVKVEDPFKNIKYDKVNDSLDLGSDWKNYKYGYGLTIEPNGNIYVPSQKNLIYALDSSKTDTKNMKTFCGNYIYVYAKDNLKSFDYIAIPNSKFTDVKIRDVLNLEIMATYPNGSFGNRKNVTEAEAIQCIVKLYGKETQAEMGNYECPGVDKNNWATKYYGLAYEYGWLNGIEEFNPSENISIEKFLHILLNSMGYEQRALEYGSYVLAARGIGLTSGNTVLLYDAVLGLNGVTFADNIDRESVAQIIHNALDTELWGVVSEEKVPIIDSTEDNSGETSGDSSDEIEYETIITYGKLDTIRETYWK